VEIVAYAGEANHCRSRLQITTAATGSLTMSYSGSGQTYLWKLIHKAAWLGTWLIMAMGQKVAVSDEHADGGGKTYVLSQLEQKRLLFNSRAGPLQHMIFHGKPDPGQLAELVKYTQPTAWIQSKLARANTRMQRRVTGRRLPSTKSASHEIQVVGRTRSQL
jgi:hypothetical protein